MNKLSGKVALVTGGARGLGAADAGLLAAEGARVIITDVLDEEGTSLAQSIGADYRTLDVTSESAWERLVAEVNASHGHIDILVNNAGVVAFTPVATTPLAEWERVIAINLTGVFLGIRAVASSMKAAGGGVIVNISSTAGMMGTPT